MLTTIPFMGFCESRLADALDVAEELLCEHLAESDERFAGHDAGTIGAALYWETSYGVAFDAVARAYADYFADRLDALYGGALGLTFESMKSPKFYNFETDRVFMKLPFDSVVRLRMATPESVLEATIAETFEPRSGFIPFYSGQIVNWRAKPLDRWDHNEVGVLVRAFIAARGDADEIESEIVDALYADATFDSAIDAAVDFDALLARLTAEAA